MQDHKSAKAISDVSWSEFFRTLKYKATLYGSQVMEVLTFYASPQTCHACRYNPHNQERNIYRQVNLSLEIKYRGTHGILCQVTVDGNI